MKQQLLQENGYMPWEQNPEVFKIGKRAPHSDIIPFQDITDAVDYNKDARAVTDLNGSWRFLFFENPDQCEEAFPQGLEQPLDTGRWGFIKVPANWQMEGYDYPQYVNAKYPWEMQEDIMPPQIPRKYNPVGIYERTFELQETKGLQILRFEGMESCGEIYVNGRFVGYSEGSFTPAEFDITEFVTTGENQLVVKVLRWCDGSWLEDQDFWRLSGIFRDVLLYTLPEVHISDFHVDATLDEEYQDGILHMEAAIAGEIKADCTVEAELYGPGGKQVIWEGSAAVNGGGAVLDAVIETPWQWSAESPMLYTLVLRLVHGEQEEILACRTGFRTFEIKDGIMMINNRRILFKGVNRHEFGAEFGRAITREAMVTDALIMKRNNINAVRTSHYPNHPYWYELCDEYGLYVIDETNLETHGTWGYASEISKQPEALPGSNPRWTAAVLDRVQDMYYRDRNHSSILIWSLGNESFCGDNFRKMADFLREHDATRLVHYEGSCHCPGYDDVSDLISRMYTPVKEWIAFGEGNPEKPAILCEYAHAMGNSCGNLYKYTECFEKYPKLQGGFIWDFVDQAILTRDENGKEYPGYGGDFGDSYTDGIFCGNGLLFADRTETPKLKETRICYQNIAFENMDWESGTVTIRNRSLFTDLNVYRFSWKLYLDERQTDSGNFVVSCVPGEAVTVQIPVVSPGLDQECFLDLQAELKEPAVWAEKGYAMAKGQFSAGSRKDKAAMCEEGELQVKENFSTIIVSGDEFTYRFSKRSGDFYSICRNGREYLKAPVESNFWRASTDNDRGSKQSFRSVVWRYAGARASKWVGTPDVRSAAGAQAESGHTVEIDLRFVLPVGGETSLDSRITILTDGTICFENRMSCAENLPDIPEIGLMFTLPASFDRFEWHGRGEHENYIDRRSSAFVGTWRAKVAERIVPYLMPQECGNMTDVRRLTLTAGNGQSITFTGLPLVEANVLPYTPEEMEAAAHQKDLLPSDKTVVRINCRQTGVGGDDSWSVHARANEEFRIPADGEYRFAFAVKPE